MAKFRMRSVERGQNQRLIYGKVRERNRLCPTGKVIKAYARRNSGKTRNFYL